MSEKSPFASSWKQRQYSKMDATLEQACADLAPEWIDLTARVRGLALDLKSKAADTSLSRDTEVLAREAETLCNHVDRLHGDIKALISRFDTSPDNVPNAGREDPDDLAKESIQIQREVHEMRPDVLDIVKALFMWRDAPEERVHSKDKEEPAG